MPHSVTELASAPLLAPAPTSLMAQCVTLVSADLAATETRLLELLESSITIIPKVAGHLAEAGGKRFRPLLTLLCARAAGFHDDARITVAAVGELLHTATLLHDDVIDEGEYRRGRPAPRVEFGNGLAVLTGDYCLARALQAMARTGEIEAVGTMADTVTKMAEGEVAQLDAAGDVALDRARYELIIERKTATLIAWCAEVAGLVRLQVRVALHDFGRELGFAFQIADDLLDYDVPDGSGLGASGKNPGQDLREGKWTLPLLLACEADPALRADVQAALRAPPPMDEEVVEDVVHRVLASDGPDRARAIAHAHAERAVEALGALPRSEARTALQEIARFVVRRRN